MKVNRRSLIACLLTGLVYSAGVSAQDQQDLSSPATENGGVYPNAATENGITYMSGGIGEQEAKAMKQAAKDYDMVLTFATRERGAYVADVKVDIEDAKGNNVLSTVSEGPIFLADMPPGKYVVKAETEGKTVTKQVNVNGHKPVQNSVLWPQKLVQTKPLAPEASPEQ
jgi:hypothetical protein